MSSYQKLSLLAAALMMSGVASAAVVTLDPISDAWQNNVGGTNVTLDATGIAPATASARWGNEQNDNDLQSGYDFQTVATPIDIDVPPGNSFLLGTFTHLNNIISAGTSITSIQLALSAGVSVDGNSATTSNFVFNFAHNETDNQASDCSNGDGTTTANGLGVHVNGCADIISVMSADTTDSFTIDGVQYTLSITGFSTDGGLTIVDSFLTTEAANNNAQLFGAITAVVNVPEPASLALIGVGLLGFAAMRRRKV